MESIDKINYILTKRGIEGTPMCLAIGLSKSIYSQWNLRKTKPTKKTLKLIADYLGVDVAEIMPDKSLNRSISACFLTLPSPLTPSKAEDSERLPLKER